MSGKSSRGAVDAVIVGAGPVGLLLGCCLHRAGLSFAILEKRGDSRGSTSAIGVHPPSLELFQQIGLLDQLVARGVIVNDGRVLSGLREIGRISFSRLPLPFNFVLSVPQYETERVLEQHLNDVAPGCLRRGARVESFDERGDAVRVQFRTEDGSVADVGGKFIIGCDGKNSLVREQAGIAFQGGTYDDSFVMGDGIDASGLGKEARIYLDDRGFIESFPLPSGMRRWVVHRGRNALPLDDRDIIQNIRERAGQRLDPNFKFAPFSIYHYVAATFARGRVVLAGDAAHIMSPIGGQGMNVGWMDAAELTSALRGILKDGLSPGMALNAYSAKARARARKAISRSEFYMAIGRGGKLCSLKCAALGAALRVAGNNSAARYFTMHGL